MEFLDAYSISSVAITNPGTEVRTVSSKEHHSPCHCCQWHAWFKGWQQRASQGQLLHCPRVLRHKTSSHGTKGLNVWWQWQDFGGTLKLSEALAVYYWSVTVPCFVLWLVTKLWGIYLYGILASTPLPSWKLPRGVGKNKSMTFCGPKSPQRFRH